MVNFSHDKSFNGTCAPFVYIEGCSHAARHAIMTESRVWLAIETVGFLILLSAVIYRFTRVSEKFNTLRLILLLYLSGTPFFIVYDAIRGTSETAHGVPPHVMGLLWWGGAVPPVSAGIVMAVTYVTFSSSNVLVRSPLTANPALYWGIQIPFLVISIILPIISGVNYWYYFIATRIYICALASLLFTLSLICAYFGTQTLRKVKAVGDTFNYYQQLRMLIFLVAAGIIAGIVLAVQAYFLDSIDNFYQIFILCTTVYRMGNFISVFGGGAYVWYAAIHNHRLNSGSLKSQQSGSKRHSGESQGNVKRSEDAESSSSTNGSSESDDSHSSDERV